MKKVINTAKDTETIFINNLSEDKCYGVLTKAYGRAMLTKESYESHNYRLFVFCSSHDINKFNGIFVTGGDKGLTNIHSAVKLLMSETNKKWVEDVFEFDDPKELLLWCGGMN